VLLLVSSATNRPLRTQASRPSRPLEVSWYLLGTQVINDRTNKYPMVQCAGFTLQTSVKDIGAISGRSYGFGCVF
jgi:hypothetical protein